LWREVWVEPDPVGFNGGTTLSIDTNIVPEGIDLCHVRAYMFVDKTVGTPQFAPLIVDVNNGYLRVIVSNIAPVGNMAAITLDIWYSHDGSGEAMVVSRRSWP
jgi:hypothetical protein